VARNIAVIGALRSGKDSAAKYLVEQYGYTKFALADRLKDEVVTALNAVEGGWSRARLEEEKTRLRSLLQVWGTEFRRASDANYWTDKLADALTRHQAPDLGRAVVTDARFTNELNMLRERGFTIVRLEMDDITLRKHLHTVAGMSDEQIDTALIHPSEQEWRNYEADFVVPSELGYLDRLIADVAVIALNEEER
jgi:hypothetical protein